MSTATPINARKRLSNGKTPRQALMERARSLAQRPGWLATYGVVAALEGAEQAPAGSELRESFDWWESASVQARRALVSDVRRVLRGVDRVMQQKIAR